MLLLLVLGCALKGPHTGLVQADPAADRLVLVENEGRELTLVARDDAAPLHLLEGCTVEVSGPRLGRRIVVQDWAVLDAGDGSAPFVGVLYRDGLQWKVRDRNSGVVVVLEPETMGGLRDHEGDPVMVVGYVLGAHRVNVVAWKALVVPAEPDAIR